MKFFSRIASLFSTVVILSVFEMWALKPDWYPYCGAGIVVVYILTIWLITEHPVWHSHYWSFFINPFVFLAGAFAFFSLIDSDIVRQLYLLGVGTAYYLVLRNIFSFLHQTKDYQPYALENMYGYLNVLSLFLFSSCFFGFCIMFGWPSWIFIAPVIFLGGFLFYRTIVAHKIPWQGNWLWILLIGVLAGEAYYTLSWLPTTFLFNALVLITGYYFVANVVRDYLEASFDQKNIRRYVLISALILICALLTVRWF